MIMPNKYIQEDDALIGAGAIVLSLLSSEQTLSDLWDKVKTSAKVSNFERFILTLDLLYLLGLIEFEDTNIVKVAL